MRIFLLFLLLSGPVLAYDYDREPEILYETFPETHIPDPTRPSIYIDEDGTAYETFDDTTVPDYSKPIYAPLEPRRKYDR